MARARDDRSQPDLNGSDRNINEDLNPTRNASGRSASGRTTEGSDRADRQQEGGTRSARTGSTVDGGSTAEAGRTTRPGGADRDSRETPASRPARDVRNASSRHQSGSTNRSETRARGEDNRRNDRNDEAGELRGGSRNDSVDSSVELSDRGGIRPEENDRTDMHDRSRDRNVDRDVM